MIKNILNSFKNLDKKAITIMKYGLKFCSMLGIIALIILISYNFSTNSFLYIFGITLFRLSLTFCVEFVICAFAMNKIKNELI